MISLCLNVFWSFALIHLDKREHYKSSLNSSLVSGGEWSSQAEWCSWWSGTGRAAGVRGALATPLCVSQWGQSQGFHLPQWHQGEFSVTQHHFLQCLSSQKDSDVILQICIVCLSSVFTHHATAVSVSSLRSWQWPAWLCPCQRSLQSNGLSDALNFITQDPLGAFGLFTTADKCQLIFRQAVLTIPGLKLHIALALPLCPNQK